MMSFAGWKYPVQVDSKTGKIKATDLETDIRESILILLKTKKGERIGHPNFGCDLDRFMFEEITYRLIQDIKDEILLSLSIWETRIENTVVNVTADPDVETKLQFVISYTVKETKMFDEIALTGKDVNL